MKSESREGAMERTFTNQAEKEIDDAYLAELKFELGLRMRDHVIEWSRQFGDRFFFAAYSAVKGAWDDVKKDLRRGRISLEDAIKLIDKMAEVRLITPAQYNHYLDQFKSISYHSGQCVTVNSVPGEIVSVAFDRLGCIIRIKINGSVGEYTPADFISGIIVLVAEQEQAR